MTLFPETLAHERRRTPRILVVDDAPQVRDVHARLLRAFGMEVVMAENGAVALAAARREVPDVVVTDLDMPQMNGLDLCRHLRADATTRDIAVVVVTGDASAHDVAAAGCDAVLQKPCSLAQLLTTIRGLLDGSRLRRIAPSAGSATS